MNLIAELTDKHDAEFEAFWQSRHPLPLTEARFDPDGPLHRVWCEWDGFGRILSAVVMVPFIENGIFHGHHAYLASHRRSKALVTFCREAMAEMRNDPGFGIICIQSRQLPGYECIDKLASHLGFSPVFVPDGGFTDFVWNSKESRREETAPCHQ